MQDFMYSVIGVIAIFIHLIINNRIFFQKQETNRITKTYKVLMLSILAYYITDAGWGFFAGLNNIPALFLDTTIYYVAMASALLSWALYIIDYLNIKNKMATIIKYFFWGFFIVEVGLLVVNFFVPCFFTFDPETGAYEALRIRYIALWAQAVLFFLTVLMTGYSAFRKDVTMKKRYLAIFFFSIIMTFSNFIQILYPLYPIYAMGCLVGSCVLHVFIIEDEREEYRKSIAEQKNIAEAANNAKTTFLFNMSHDIRTPMNAIIGFTAMAKKYSTDERVNDYLEKIDISGNQLLRLINQVLEMARIESGKIELNEQPLSLSEKRKVLSTIYREIASSKDITFEVVPGTITHNNVVIDVDRMDQITNNIISNAIKYTLPGGKVTYTTNELPYDKEGYALYEIAIEDNGMGMSKEYLDHVFDEFSRENSSTISKIQGTGLGMSIVKKVSDLMGGSVKIESEKNVGTTVTITMPMKIDDGVREEKVDEEVIISNVTGLKVLLVEDNEMNREIATEILEEAKMIVLTAEDGDVAFEKVKNSKPGDFNVILMDIQMPRMNGYDATKAIRNLDDEELANIPIIAMTANAFEEDRQNALNAGMNDHVAKPIDVRKLVFTISRYVKK